MIEYPSNRHSARGGEPSLQRVRRRPPPARRPGCAVPGPQPAARPRRGLAYLAVFAAAAVGAGLVRTVATTYLPVLLAEVKQAPGLIGTAMIVNSPPAFAPPLAAGISGG